VVLPAGLEEMWQRVERYGQLGLMSQAVQEHEPELGYMALMLW
jgi:hypothetical protein